MVGKMSMLRTLMGLAVSAMLINLAMATNFTVGGPNGGWDTSTNLQGWASSQAFEVGDNLIFQYGGNHNVLEVTRADYDSCQTSNPLQMFSGGTTIIPLASAVNRYFICGTAGHCGQGMKIEVDILAASSPTPSAPPPSTPSTPPPASPVTPPTSSPPPQTASPPSVNSPPSPPTESPPLPEPPVSGPGSDSPANSPPPSVTSPPPPSSATKVKLMAGSTVVLGFVTMMILTLRI